MSLEQATKIYSQQSSVFYFDSLNQKSICPEIRHKCAICWCRSCLRHSSSPSIDAIRVCYFIRWRWRRVPAAVRRLCPSSLASPPTASSILLEGLTTHQHHFACFRFWPNQVTIHSLLLIVIYCATEETRKFEVVWRVQHTSQGASYPSISSNT